MLLTSTISWGCHVRITNFYSCWFHHLFSFLLLHRACLCPFVNFKRLAKDLMQLGVPDFVEEDMSQATPGNPFEVKFDMKEAATPAIPFETSAYSFNIPMAAVDFEEDGLPPPPEDGKTTSGGPNTTGGDSEGPGTFAALPSGVQRNPMQEKMFRQFLRREGTCDICDKYLGKDQVMTMENCKHRFCQPCLRTYLMKLLKQLRTTGKLSSHDMTCPADPRCLHRVPDWMSKRVLTPQDYNDMIDFSLKAFLDGHSQLFVSCPNPECKNLFEAIAGSVEDASSVDATGPDGKPLTKEALEHRAQHRFRCSKCTTIFCSHCNAQPYHDGFTCEKWKEYENAKHCRYCETQLTDENTAPMGPKDGAGVEAVCTSEECVSKKKIACGKLLECKHPCCGIRDEKQCMPCIEPECAARDPNDDTCKDDYCNICWVESIGGAPSIKLNCGHIFHFSCILQRIKAKWPGARIHFAFMNCPLCKQPIGHPSLDKLLVPYQKLRRIVAQKALKRLKIEALDGDPDITDPSGRYFGNPGAYALDRFAYYMCYKCKMPYFGGKRACEDNAREDDVKFDPQELVCGSCSASKELSTCAEHGREFIIHKCRFCCNVASFYCWGSTHFCRDCHKRQEQGDYLTKKKPEELPQCPGVDKCPLGMDHSQPPCELVIGCGVCRKS
jgi:IBR domain, a half RING-finger domain/Zinc finger, C3HC4 type (RING finger)